MTTLAVAAGTEAAFRARGLTKIYRIGEVEVQALRSVDLDLYEGEMVVLLGRSMHASAFGVWPLVDVNGTPDIDAGSMQRYLAEAAWLPTALLPEQGVAWTPLDDTSAMGRACRRHGKDVSRITKSVTD